MPLIPYPKHWLSLDDQIKLLQSRGLVIADPMGAAKFLSHLNYSRFGGYCLAFEQTRHTFIQRTTFEQIQYSYEFDRMLRDHVNEALEVIELDFRTAFAYNFAHRYGPFGHTQARNFYAHFDHSKWVKKLREETTRSSELFVTHFSSKYQEFPDLPLWIATEVMSFGALSRMFSGLHNPDKKLIASRYSLQPSTFSSWLHHLVYLRNLCAHHSRLWDRIWSIKPRLPAGHNWSAPLLPSNERLFSALLLHSTILKHCPTMNSFRIAWKIKIEALLSAPPACANPNDKMGLTQFWMAHPCWI